MKPRTCLIIILLLSQLGTTLTPSVKASGSLITVPDDYTSIQAAIDAADNGDSIYVRNGTYNESLLIDKKISLMGEDPGSTVIDGQGDSRVIDVDSDNVSISCFTIRNGDYGVYFDNSNDAELSSSIIYNNTWNGVENFGSTGVRVILCMIYNNTDGIKIEHSCETEVYNCEIYNNSDDGIQTSDTRNLRVFNTSIHHNNWGMYLSDTDVLTLCGNRIHDNDVDGISIRDSEKMYMTKTSIYNNTGDGLEAYTSNGVITSSNFTGNQGDGLSFQESVFRLRYLGVWDNQINEITSSMSTVDARYCWWGDPGDPGPMSPDIEYDPWQLVLDQPGTLISDHRCHQYSLEWLVVYPDSETPKPLGCAAASVSDWLASAFVTTKIEYPWEALDTNGTYVNQTTGMALGYPGSGVLTFGGPIVNPLVKRAEDPSTPDADRAPVKWRDAGGVYLFQTKNGTDIPGTELPISSINDDEDIFVIERYVDNHDQINTICYGFGWKGTYAAGKYFDDVVYPQLAQYTTSYIIVRWEDSNGDGFVNNPIQGDTYTIVATG